MSVASEIYSICTGSVLHLRPGRIDVVRIKVGELSAVEPDLLNFAWEALTREGPDEGSRLDIQFCPSRQFCPSCGEVKVRLPGSWFFVCPECSAPLKVTGGRELDIVNISFRQTGEG
ncbi:MAG TPA: hydrogenase maturation nickel metallochaperone HypA [Thermoanaerobaculia bacterium]|nr:hydrogenase maturation nickel metallochaperone HypA [Thermoanaerobaculia bacterium]HUM28657.1 hydrogenase maturation nickel metallochaperone HypA [Thermoanaerobaculia bacterium]HXK66735.1 hydrogenase maturation nickel metallochaperone HypA [Thermoanaerobaculia bacterium]